MSPALTVSFFFFLAELGFELRGSCLQTGALPLVLSLQSILLWLFWRWGLLNYLPGLASNDKPPDLSLLSSYNYRHEPPVPSEFTVTESC
jgi:hypothetical protein